MSRTRLLSRHATQQGRIGRMLHCSIFFVETPNLLSTVADGIVLCIIVHQVQLNSTIFQEERDEWCPSGTGTVAPSGQIIAHGRRCSIAELLKYIAGTSFCVLTLLYVSIYIYTYTNCQYHTQARQHSTPHTLGRYLRLFLDNGDGRRKRRAIAPASMERSRQRYLQSQQFRYVFSPPKAGFGENRLRNFLPGCVQSKVVPLLP